jgi:hypothetical protein
MFSRTVVDPKICRLVFALTFLLAEPVLSLQMTEMPQNGQTKVKEPRERTISLKLPLLQPRFHWTFMNREDFLSGKLLLRIIRDGQSNEIVIFEKGRFSDGWEAMPMTSMPDKGEIYFGFISTHKYLTAPGDKLELELTVIKDLPGIGAIQTGTLPAEKYESRGTYSWLTDEYDTTLLAKELSKEGKISPIEQETLFNKLREMCEHKAFLESWKDQWPLIITSEKGWLSEEKASEFKKMMEKSNKAKLEPPTGSAGPPVKDKNLFQKYLNFWIITPPIALFIIIILRRAFAKI